MLDFILVIIDIDLRMNEALQTEICQSWRLRREGSLRDQILGFFIYYIYLFCLFIRQT